MKTTSKRDFIPARVRRAGVLAAWLWLCLALPARAQTSPADQITGDWLTADGNSKIHIAPTNSLYGGTVIWIAPRPKTDAPEKSKPAAIGVEVLSGFKYDGGSNWVGGKVYVPARDKHLDGRLHLQSPDVLEVNVTAGFMRKTIVWTRVK